jgi:putative tricarboxylic transport membrane protein
MLSYGIQPGPRLLETEPGVFWGVIVSMYIGNLILLALNLPLIPYISRVIYLSRKILIPFVIAFSMLGVYLTTMNPFDIFLMLGFGLAAFLLRSAGFPLAPLLLGFILSGMLEENLRRTLYLSEGSLTIFFQSPLSATLLTVCLIVWAIPLVRIANDLRRGGNPRD